MIRILTGSEILASVKVGLEVLTSIFVVFLIKKCFFFSQKLMTKMVEISLKIHSE